MKDLSQTRRPLESLLPGGAEWLQDSVVSFDPSNNCLHTKAGDTVTYDWLVIATGLVLRSVIHRLENIDFLVVKATLKLAGHGHVSVGE